MLNKLFGKKENIEKKLSSNERENPFVNYLINKYKNNINFNNLKDINKYEMEIKDVAEKILKENLLDQETFFKELSIFYSFSYKNMENIDITGKILEIMSIFDKEEINNKKFMILNTDNNTYTIGMCYIDQIDIIERIKLNNIKVKIEKVCISYVTFDYLYNNYLDKINILPENSLELSNLPSTLEIEDLTNEDNPIVKLVNDILLEAIRKESSDIHIEPYKNEVKIKNRIDGVLIGGKSNIPKNFHEMIISRIKILASLNIAEHRVPQDGRFKKIIENKEIDFRVSIIPTSFGESIVIRILDKRGAVLSLEGLGMSQKEKDEIINYGIAPYGMILVTGPTGSGKTTTLYALLNRINQKEEKIITIEDPVEYQLDDIVQIPVNEKKGLTFAKGLRSILRQDPDKIMVGEIRDSETAEIAVQAALTGHLVLTTLHSNSTVESIGRLLNMGIDTYQFVTALNVIIGQRLMRKVCILCNGKGCIDCNNSGYKGRVGVYEIFHLDNEIKEMIIAKESPIKIKERAINKGMIDIQTRARNRVEEHVTTKDEYERIIGKWVEV